MIKPLLIALQFLTRLPVPGTDTVTDRQIGQSLLFYPAVGLLIGSLLALTAWATEGSPEGVRAGLRAQGWNSLRRWV